MKSLLPPGGASQGNPPSPPDVGNFHDNVNALMAALALMREDCYDRSLELLIMIENKISRTRDIKSLPLLETVRKARAVMVSLAMIVLVHLVLFSRLGVSSNMKEPSRAVIGWVLLSFLAGAALNDSPQERKRGLPRLVSVGEPDEFLLWPNGREVFSDQVLNKGRHWRLTLEGDYLLRRPGFSYPEGVKADAMYHTDGCGNFALPYRGLRVDGVPAKSSPTLEPERADRGRHIYTFRVRGTGTTLGVALVPPARYVRKPVGNLFVSVQELGAPPLPPSRLPLRPAPSSTRLALPPAPHWANTYCFSCGTRSDEPPHPVHPPTPAFEHPEDFGPETKPAPPRPPSSPRRNARRMTNEQFAILAGLLAQRGKMAALLEIDDLSDEAKRRLLDDLTKKLAAELTLLGNQEHDDEEEDYDGSHRTLD